MTATKVANLLFMLRSRDWEDSAVEGGGGANLDILEQVQHDHMETAKLTIISPIDIIYILYYT